MKKIIKVTLIGFALASGSIGITLSAIAADNVAVGVNAGGVAFGYSDGYWDRDRQWHDWKNKEESEHYRAENREHYYDRKHDEDKDKGWRDSDRWWDRH